MKKLLLLFAALLVAGCGEKSSSEGSESASESATPPSEDVKPSADSPKPLISDVDVERLLKEAVDMESLEERDGLFYLNGELYSGWLKQMYDSGQAGALVRLKDGKQDGPYTAWHENGQKAMEGTKPDGLCTEWHENGQKKAEETYKDGELDGPATYWHANGLKQIEATYKDGKQDGPATYWHENGQKGKAATYKDGELVSAKYWNSKGEEVETLEEAEK